MKNVISSREFQRRLLALLVKDSKFLKECHALLSEQDFRPAKRESRANWIIAQLALDYYEKYREPIKTMLLVEVEDHIRKSNMKSGSAEELLETAKKIRRAKIKAVDSIRDKLIEYKKERAKSDAVRELIDLQTRNQLSDEKWIEICEKGIAAVDPGHVVTREYFGNIDDRISRRKAEGRSDREPVLFVDAFDNRLRSIGRGHLGMVVAPPGRGKSMFFIHIAKSYAIQAWNVLYITLEDPIRLIEDRFDAAVTQVPIRKLRTMPVTVRKRYRQYQRLVRGRLRIVDGTEGGMTVKAIEDVFLQQRNRGFLADVVIVDYDDEIVPPRKQKERRLEFGDIYRALRQFLARYDVILWTGSQTNRKSRDWKWFSEQSLAEDTSKLRKVSLALGLGKGDWGPESIFLHVMKHKTDKMQIGWNIMTNRKRSMFYDRDRSLGMEKKEARDKKK